MAFFSEATQHIFEERGKSCTQKDGCIYMCLPKVEFLEL